MGIGPNPPRGSSHGSFQMSFHPIGEKNAILLGAHCQVPSWSLTPAMGSGAPYFAYLKALLAPLSIASADNFLQFSHLSCVMSVFLRIHIASNSALK
eukprot:1931654-Heterocapsa_arctica.AAC.1